MSVNVLSSLYNLCVLRYNLTLTVNNVLRDKGTNVPIIKSAIKRMKQTAVRRERNVGIKKDIKSAVKAFLAKPTAEGLAAAQSEYDTAVKKGLLKKQTASRRKAGLAKVAKEAGVKMPATKKAPAKAAAKPAAKNAYTALLISFLIPTLRSRRTAVCFMRLMADLMIGTFVPLSLKTLLTVNVRL
jgi:ribosomal protein S20